MDRQTLVTVVETTVITTIVNGVLIWSWTRLKNLSAANTITTRTRAIFKKISFGFVWDVVVLSWLIFALIRFHLRNPAPPSRVDVFVIAFYVVGIFCMFIFIVVHIGVYILRRKYPNL